MKKPFRLLAIFLLIYASLGSLAPQSGYDQFQKALAKERGEGNLEEAIALYQKVVEGTKDESLAAEAQLRIGLCYEKLGRAKAALAQEAFQKVVDKYPGQSELVKVAKTRLAGLATMAGAPLEEPVFRKIQTPFRIPQWSGGCLSPDGKTLAFGSQNVIWTVPIPGKVAPNLAGEPNKVPGTEGTLGQGLTWSRDGRWIAFSRAFRQVGGGYVRFNPAEAYIDVIPASGGASKRIAIPQWVASEGATNRELCLSPDGKTVAFDAKGQLYAASVETGEIKQLTKDGGTVPSYSPDGKKIAYLTPPVMQKDPPQVRNELWVIPSSGGEPVKISGGQGALIRSSLWSPDGKMIAYLQHYPSTKPTSEVWIVPLSDGGKPGGEPVRIKLPLFSRERLTGWTPDDKIGLLFEIPFNDYVYTVPAAGGKASQVSPLEGLADHPQWSPDGKRIYFRWEDGRLASVPSEGGEIRVHPSLKGALNSGFFMPYPAGGNAVSPDGKSVVLSAGSVGAPMQIFTVPVDGGEPKKITTGEGHRFPSWSPDGKWIACIGSEVGADKKEVTVIFRVPAEGGDPMKVTAGSAKVMWADLDWSPDGKWLAYFSKEADSQAGALNAIPAEGGEPRVICQVPEVSGHSDLSWSPDGKKIAFVSEDKIWVVPTEGGEPVELKTDVDAEALELDWSPDGKKIAFSGRSGWAKEFWFMEDFLRLLKR